jgi:hypothetical protein
MSRLGYRNPCALVAARLLLNTTWSLRLPYKAAWGIEMKKFYLSVVISVVLAEMETVQGQTEESQAQKEVHLRPRTARLGTSILAS